MTYQQTLDYIFTKLPMFSRIGAAAFKADLTNTLALCEVLGNPQKKFKSIHIAGTNGKGSTSHMIAAILQTAGYKTGLYTSPHLKDFRERIKLNGEFISEQFIIDFIERIQPVIDTIEPSFFEITVAMAFEYFAQEKADVAVIEVGLGGRLDSTNVIIPELSVITNIGMDHMQFLGDTLDKIAAEKAGIIKHKIPVVVGEVLPETGAVFEEKAMMEEAPLIIATEQYYVADWHIMPHELKVDVVHKRNDDHKTYHLDLQGIYQVKNVLTVLTAIQQLEQQGWQINETHVQKALQQVKRFTGLHGRWEIIHRHPLVILDVGHNEDGIRQITSQIEVTDHNNLHIVIGMVKDKEIENVLKLLPKHASYYFTKAQIPRALDEIALAEKAAAAGLHGQHFPTVNIALNTALEHAKEDDLVVVCGSVFVVGEVNVALIQSQAIR